MSNSCMTCGGLIMEPGKVYGYAGPVCYCNPSPKYQIPIGQINYQQHLTLPKCECHSCTQSRLPFGGQVEMKRKEK